MKTYAKKRIDVVIELPVLNRVLDLLDDLAVTGYTVVPALAGRGSEGSWRRSGMVSEAGQTVTLFCILDESRVEQVLEPLYKLVSKQIGIVTISDVQVIRTEHF